MAGEPRGTGGTGNQVPFPYADPLVPPELLGATQPRSRGHRRGVAVQEHETTCIVSTAGTSEDIDRRVDKRCMRQLRRAARERVETVDLTDPVLAPQALDATLDSI